MLQRSRTGRPRKALGEASPGLRVVFPTLDSLRRVLLRLRSPFLNRLQTFESFRMSVDAQRSPLSERFRIGFRVRC